MDQGKKPTEEQVKRMRLRELAKSNLIVHVDSKVLGEAILFTGDDVNLPKNEDRVQYTGSELEQLIGVGETALKTIHETKRAFKGAVIERTRFKGRTR